MLTAGLTGGLGCGKTFVGRELERLGCVVIHADQLGHEVLALDGEAYRPVVELFGSGILREDASIDRAQLAKIVFNDAEKLSALNAIVHPAVHRLQDARIAAAAQHDPHAIVIVEAAILIETGFYRRFQRLIVVSCDESQQLERALLRDPSATRPQIEARLARQLPMAEKRAYADFLIDASGSEAHTLAQTRELLPILHRLAAENPPSQQNPAKMKPA